MTSRYNSYAAKIYAEHPIALWALDENTESATAQTVSNIGNLGSISVVEADGHTNSMAKGYYVNPDELSRNTSVPLVFGAYNSTTLYSGEGLPSLIIPAHGFLIDSGRYLNLTVEFWANITNNSPTPQRIFGPIGSTDGLYVDGPFIGLKIDKDYKSHYVGTWGRPMIIQISIIKNLATVTINGAAVIRIDDIDTDSISLSPERLENGNSLNWLGFYATEDTTPTQIDCIAIYSYMVTDILGKQRFVYGQGTQSIDTIFNSYTATPVSIDYSFSDFGKNRTYPDLFRWENGYIENLDTDLGRLSPPNYILPTISIENQTLKKWKDAQFGVNKKTFKLNVDPESSNSYSGYLVFNNLNITKDQFRGFYGVFDSPATVIEGKSQILFRVENTFNKKYFEILLSSVDNVKYIEYKLNDELLLGEILAEDLYSESDRFSVGIDINSSLADQEFSQLNDLFTDKVNSKIFIGGYQTELNNRSNFYGNIYTVGFYTGKNHKRLIEMVQDPISNTGSFNQGSWPELQNYVASYSLIPKNSLGFFELDISISGYWENTIPLRQMSKTMLNGQRELDYFQFNLDYPESKRLQEDDVEENVFYRDTSQEILRSFVIFKESEKISEPISWGVDNDIFLLPENNVVIPEESLLDNKLELCNGTIVSPPDSFLDYSAIIRLEFEIDGILSKPIRVRSLEIASRSLEPGTPNPIGTKFGKDIFPYILEGNSKNYKKFNPVSISKSRSNYLYLTQNTGVGLAGDYDQNRKISYEVNEERSSFYSIATLQFALNYPSNYFEISKRKKVDVLLFEMTGPSDSHYKLYANFSSATASDIGKIYVKKVTNGIDEDSPDTKIFLNGAIPAPVDPEFPKIKPDEWYFIGIQFDKAAQFEGNIGEVALSGPARFDNLSLYLVSESDLNARTAFRLWSSTLGNTWEPYSLTTPPVISWTNLFVGQAGFAPRITPSAIYNTYIGANSIIADSYSVNGIASDIIFTFKDYEYRVKTDVNFEQKVATPL